MTYLMFVLVVLGSVCADTVSTTRFETEAWITNGEALISKTDSYTATFHKQEYIKGKLRPAETIEYKFKKPFKVYMKWIKSPNKGREVLYVEGANDNKLKVHESGFIGITLNLDPTGGMAMQSDRHPVHHSGLAHLLKTLRENYIKAKAAGEVVINDLGDEVVYSRKTRKIEQIFPKDASRGYYAHRVIINIDVELDLPIKVQIFDYENRLIESYGFENLNLKAGLTDADFDSRNPNYKF